MGREGPEKADNFQTALMLPGQPVPGILLWAIDHSQAASTDVLVALPGATC